MTTQLISDSEFTRRIKAREAEIEKLHEKTFRAWSNAQYTKHNHSTIEHLSTAFADGLKLIDLIELLSGQTLARKYNKQPVQEFQKKENIAIGVDFLNTFIAFQARTADIEEGNMKVILALMWHAILFFNVYRSVFQDAKVEEGPDKFAQAKQRLLNWCNNTLKNKGINISNFEDSWYDGLGFAGLVHEYDNSLLDWEEIKKITPKERLEKAFKAAETFGIAPILDVADLIHEDPDHRTDEQCVMTYVSQFPIAFLEREKSALNKAAQEQEQMKAKEAALREAMERERAAKKEMDRLIAAAQEAEKLLAKSKSDAEKQAFEQAERNAKAAQEEVERLTKELEALRESEKKAREESELARKRAAELIERASEEAEKVKRKAEEEKAAAQAESERVKKLSAEEAAREKKAREDAEKAMLEAKQEAESAKSVASEQEKAAAEAKRKAKHAKHAAQRAIKENLDKSQKEAAVALEKQQEEDKEREERIRREHEEEEERLKRMLADLKGEYDGLKRRLIGKLHVTLKKAIHLRDSRLITGHLGLCSPYCVVGLDKQKQKSQVCNGTHDPEWNEKLELFVEEVVGAKVGADGEPTGVLELEFFDQNKWLKDSKMGWVEIEFSKKDGAKQEGWFFIRAPKLQGDKHAEEGQVSGKEYGEVQLSLWYEKNK